MNAAFKHFLVFVIISMWDAFHSYHIVTPQVP